MNKVNLRPFTLDDVNRLVEMADNVNISANLRDGFPSPFTKQSAIDFITQSTKENRATRFAIECDGVYVGNIGIHPQEDIYHRTAELGYFVGEEYWGNGIASEAIAQICVYGFKELDLIRIEAGVFEYNEASKKVLIKNGFEFEGVARNVAVKRGSVLDEHKYSLINPLYAQRQRQS